jgi:hypothetical protein
MEEIGFIVLGALGYQGKLGLHAVAKLRDRFSPQNITPRLIAFIDPAISRELRSEAKQNHWDHLADVHGLFGYVPRIDADLESIGAHITTFSTTKPNHPVVIYDASPSITHFENLRYIANVQTEGNFNILYIGEKPIFIDPGDDNRSGDSDIQDQVDFARHSLPSTFKLFCELVELENPVFKTAREIITEQNLEIEEIWLWRAGSSALKKIAGVDRAGVMGGAIEDKSLHDFSITVGLIGPSEIDVAGFSNVEISCDGVENLCLSREAALGVERSFLARSNHTVSIDEIDLHFRHRFPADACSRLEFSWPLRSGRHIKAHYLFSWIGRTNAPIEFDFVQQFEQYGVDLPVGRKDYPDHVEEEIRAAVISCQRKDGSKVSILCNFLFKEDYCTRDRRLERFVKIVENGQLSKEESRLSTDAATYAEVKADDMSGLFESVVRCGLGGTDYGNVLSGREMTLLTHKALLLCQRAVRKSFSSRLSSPDSREWLAQAFTRSKELIATKAWNPTP